MLTMVKKVKKRTWSLEKFTNAVKGECKRLGAKPGSAAAIKKHYDDGSTAKFTASTFATKN
jgi:hypothetical protein